MIFAFLANRDIVSLRGNDVCESTWRLQSAVSDCAVIIITTNQFTYS